jgi:hypothetical protein
VERTREPEERGESDDMKLPKVEQTRRRVVSKQLRNRETLKAHENPFSATG